MFNHRPHLGRTHQERILAKRDLPCESCGHNLRGSKGEVCPECGTALSLERLRERIPPIRPPHTPEPWQLRYAKAYPWLWGLHAAAFIGNTAWIIYFSGSFGVLIAFVMVPVYGYGAILLHSLDIEEPPPASRRLRLDSDAAVAMIPVIWLLPIILGLLLRFALP